MLASPKQHGVTLIELLIGVAIMTMLLLVGVPSFRTWIQNTQVRTAAESIQNGLQIARNEAVRRNTEVRFQFNGTSGIPSWTVGCVTVVTAAENPCPAEIQKRAGGEGGTNARVGVSKATIDATTNYGAALVAGDGFGSATTNTWITFNGLGATVNGTNDMKRIDVTNAAASDARRLVIIVTPGGLIKMCDPQLTGNPQSCS